MKKFLLFYFLVMFNFSFAQQKDPDKILDQLKSAFSKVEDYEVNVKIKVDVEFIKIPVTEAKIYYKQPDKINVQSENFALIPREGLDFSPLSLLKDKYTAIYERDENLNGVNTSVIKIIPIGDHGNVILSTLWIDQDKDVVRKIESTTKTAGTFSIELKYDETFVYPLPVSMVFSFNMDQLNLPKGMTGEMNDKKDKTEKKTTGNVYITYSNYQVNKGIPDSMFEQKEK